LSELIAWAVFLGVGLPLKSFQISCLIAAAVSLAGLGLQAYRYWGEKSLRIFPKTHPTLCSATW
jgi:hypothetical protein